MALITHTELLPTDEEVIYCLGYHIGLSIDFLFKFTKVMCKPGTKRLSFWHSEDMKIFQSIHSIKDCYLLWST